MGPQFLPLGLPALVVLFVPPPGPSGIRKNLRSSRPWGGALTTPLRGPTPPLRQQAHLRGPPICMLAWATTARQVLF